LREPVPLSSNELDKIPEQYRQYSRVFSEEALHEFPPSRLWDHAIELKPGAPASLPRKLIPLSQPELTELQKFIKEHLTQGTIHHIILLHQKERWKTTTHPRLSSYQ